MATLRPVSGRMELARRLGAAVGVAFPLERLVIEVDVREPIRVYVKAPADVSVVERITEAFESIPVDGVAVEDDTSVIYAVRRDAPG